MSSNTYSVTVEYRPEFNRESLQFDTEIAVYINGNRAQFRNTSGKLTRNFPPRAAMYLIALFDLQEKANTQPINKTATFANEAPIEKVKQFFTHPDLIYGTERKQ